MLGRPLHPDRQPSIRRLISFTRNRFRRLRHRRPSPVVRLRSPRKIVYSVLASFSASYSGSFNWIRLLFTHVFYYTEPRQIQIPSGRFDIEMNNNLLRFPSPLPREPGSDGASSAASEKWEDRKTCVDTDCTIEACIVGLSFRISVARV